MDIIFKQIKKWPVTLNILEDELCMTEKNKQSLFCNYLTRTR